MENIFSILLTFEYQIFLFSFLKLELNEIHGTEIRFSKKERLIWFFIFGAMNGFDAFLVDFRFDSLKCREKLARIQTQFELKLWFGHKRCKIQIRFESWIIFLKFIKIWM
jgi:hypothetical protein